MKESKESGSAAAFTLQVSIQVRDCVTAEKLAHKVLSRFRASKKEYFNCTVKEALCLILPKIGRYKLVDAPPGYEIKKFEREVKSEIIQSQINEANRHLHRLKQRELELRIEVRELGQKRHLLARKIADLDIEYQKLGVRPEPDSFYWTLSVLALPYFTYLAWGAHGCLTRSLFVASILIWCLGLLGSKGSAIHEICKLWLNCGWLFFLGWLGAHLAYKEKIKPFLKLEQEITNLRNEFARVASDLGSLESQCHDIRREKSSVIARLEELKTKLQRLRE